LQNFLIAPRTSVDVCSMRKAGQSAVCKIIMKCTHRVILKTLPIMLYDILYNLCGNDCAGTHYSRCCEIPPACWWQQWTRNCLGSTECQPLYTAAPTAAV